MSQDNPTSKEQFKQQYATAGQSFTEVFNHVRAAVMSMGGRPTSDAFKQVARLSDELSHKAMQLADLMEQSENAIRRANQKQSASSFVPNPDDPFAPSV